MDALQKGVRVPKRPRVQQESGATPPAAQLQTIPLTDSMRRRLQQVGASCILLCAQSDSLFGLMELSPFVSDTSMACYRKLHC